MVWLGIGVELILVGMIIVLGRKERKNGRMDLTGNLHLLQIAGKHVAKWLEPATIQKERNQIYQIVCKLAGEEEGEKLFQKYRQKRWSMILSIVLLINGGLIFGGMLPRQQEVEVFSIEQKRPDYGEGDINEQVTVILSGEKNAKSTISIRIPEKEISQKEALDKVREGIRYIQAYFENIKVKENISFPTEWNEVSFYYESLSPELLSNNGGWIGEIKKEPQLIEIKVTAALAGQSLTETLQLQTVTISELSAEERLRILTKKVQEGEFLTESKLVLPKETEIGEEIQWIEKEEPKEVIWILLGSILLLFALWKQDWEYKQVLKRREQHIRQVYPEFINELVILIGAGLSLPAAWKRIGQDYQNKRTGKGEINPLYEEVYRESKELDAGVPMREILEEFSSRIRLKEARRFAVMMVQNIKRGDAFLVSRLKELNQEAWEIRKKQVREKTEEADTKLLLPLMLMLAVILIIVLSPAMITMQV